MSRIRSSAKGPTDVVFVPGFVFNVEHIWETKWHEPAAFIRRLAGFARVILFDRRGTGLSDRIPRSRATLTLEARMGDIRAVMDAAGSSRATLLTFEDGLALCAMFAATYRERTTALVSYAAFATAKWAPDYIDAETDIRGLLPSILVPTLVIHRVDDEAESVEQARYIAERIPGAELIELPGRNHQWMAPDQDEVLDVIERFVGTLRAEEESFDRMLASVLFTDIVASSEAAARLGDHAWRDLLERHHAVVRGMLARYRGTEIDTAGDGFFASFDGPARAVRCACEISTSMRELGLQVRAGVHTGEVEVIDEKIGGLTVTVGARVAELADPSEVLVSRTVKDLVAGSGFHFDDAGEHELKGVSDRWQLYRVVAP